MRQRSQGTTRVSAKRQGKRAINGGAPLPTLGPRFSALGFNDAYRHFPLPADELGDYEGRVEFWDGATETAYEVREPTSPFHERPSQVLAALLERIAAVRGSPIRCFGTMDLVLPGKDGRPARLMQADQCLYLHPRRADLVGKSAMVVGEHHYPDVVLEVDLTTDVRRHKLKLYEAWGFPELWVDVPAQSQRQAQGMTIYALEEGAFQVVEESRAFPGWFAADIHQALNEDELSEHTVTVLARVGAALGAGEGTSSDDDPLLRREREQAREAGRQEAFADQLAWRAAMVRRVMLERDLDVDANFPLHEPAFATATPEAVATAAIHCVDEADFLARLSMPS